MNMLIDELRAIAATPLSWGAVLLLMTFLLYSIYHRWACPLMHNKAEISATEAQEARDRPFSAGPRFGLFMIAGITAAVAGLSLIGEGTYPLVSFYLLVAGVFTIQTEPVRLQIREAELRVIASETIGGDVKQVALERLDTTHLWLIWLQFGILVGTAVFLLAI
ncbi:MAG: hypothetical protein AAGC57_08775 [Pseudomonadota bacterium]